MKTFWAALLASVVGGIVLTLFIYLILAGMAAALSTGPLKVEANSVLKIDFSTGIKDAPGSSPFNVGFGGVSVSKANTMLQVVSALEKAASDNNIKGVLIDLTGGGSANLANIEELRSALQEFKESGKFVVSYGDYYSQIGYYLSSVSDAVLLNPVGFLDWKGMSMGVMFYKGLLDKLGVKTEVVRHGTFKSAVEPFILDSMSPENRLQYNTLVESIWEAILDDVSASRGIDGYLLDQYASGLAVRSAGDALQCGFVDALVYRDQAEWFVKKLAGGEDIPVALAKLQALGNGTDDDDKEQNYITLGNYISAGVTFGPRTSKNKVALIYAEGSIVDGGGSEDVVGTDVAARLARARKDDETKAVVLRVNSPGGSALASELIWREMELTRAVKPVIVSMGGLAASGGYYISCPADLIFTDRTTLTGSIGVFGLLFDVSGAMKDKLGITVDVVRTNPSADWGGMYRGLTQTEREAIQYSIEEVYDTFVSHVADGRNMDWDEVDAIGEGRVWTGANAVELGLADGFGGLKDAIALAADRAGIAEDFRVWQVVDQPDPVLALLESLGGIRSASVEEELGELYQEYKSIREMVSGQGVQARMPYTFVIE